MPFQNGDPKPPGSGRGKGQVNKATVEIKVALAKHVPEMVPELVRLATEAENEATRLGAIREIFDRAIGKAAQQIEGKMQVGGAPEPIRYEVALAFDPSHDDVPARISGVTPDDSALVP